MKVMQDFKFPVSSVDMALPEDKRHVLSVGIYKPSVRIYDLNSLALKTERHLESDALKITPLSEDGSKLCVLRNDRVIEFHAKYGRHENVKTPTLCYDICFNKFKAELMAGGKGRNVYRFNLEQGRFLNSYPTTIEDVCSVSMNIANGLIAIAGDKEIQFIDQRSKKTVKTVEYEESPSALAFSDNGIDFGVGTSEGIVYLHDLRSRKELLKNKHGTGVKKVLFSGKMLLSMDKDVLRVSGGSGILGEYKSESEMNCFECDEGVILIGMNNGEMKTVLSEALGRIPSWFKMVGDQ